ncbi:NAD(P)/FAD-dependent oxidoreductase [Parafrigoribacterium soli]|uniref:NAD(P)/FAD-dependent oxidoreductase n=1 Tax=Parafrigoribacterium soli TaxID=3144663 RepID=UPI0032EEDD25
MTDYDSIIVGGGAAGLAAAMVLVRGRRSVLLFDSGQQNNLRTTHSGGVFLHDGEAPSALYAGALEQLREYPTFSLLRATVESIERADGGFRVNSDQTARTIVLAQGVQFIPSEIPGVDALWGSKIVNCPFCDGYESRNMRVLGVGNEDWLAHMGGLLPNWVDDLSWSASADLESVEDVANGILVRYRDGRSETFERMFVQQAWTQRAGLADALGCDRTAEGTLVLDGFGQTTVPGIFAAGDQTGGPMQVNLAVGSGHLAGIGAINALVAR